MKTKCTQEIKRDCIWYDYGGGAPTTYGPWCEKKQTGIQQTDCRNCRLFILERRNHNRRKSNNL